MDVIWLIFLLALGACVGSFLNVVIYRLPRGESIVFPGSHCPSCGRAIRWYDNLPLVSWLVLRGRCRFCKTAISPRYLVIEAVTALLAGGLYAWYYLADFRGGAGAFTDTWPTYAAHALLLCGLLACSAVDVEKWIVPLEVCWFVSLAGVVALAASTPAVTMLPRVSATTGAMALVALVGLLIALGLLRWGVIQRSFLDADDKPVTGTAKPAPPAGRAQGANPPPTSRRKNKKKRGKGRKGKTTGRAAKPAPKPAPKITAVAATKEHGVNPRREVLREVLFLAPAILLAIGAYVLLKEVPSVGAAWRRLHSSAETGRWAGHLGAAEAAVFGYLIGGLWIWGIRILGTLGFGKEAMGLGDVHILAAVGACCGWIVPSVAFFLAPIFGLAWAIYLWAGRKQRELPYGPWLAVATLVVMLFHDSIMKFLEPYRRVLG